MNNKQTFTALSQVEPLTPKEISNINALLWLSKHPYFKSLDIDFYEEGDDEGGTYSTFNFNGVVLDPEYIDEFLALCIKHENKYKTMYSNTIALKNAYINDYIERTTHKIPEEINKQGINNIFMYLLEKEEYRVDWEISFFLDTLDDYLIESFRETGIMDNYRLININFFNIDWESSEITNLLTKYREYIINISSTTFKLLNQNNNI